jgi:ATP synthase protein I
MLLIVAVAALLWWAAPVWSGAWLCGGLIEILSRLYFGFYAFRFSGARQIRQVAGAFKRGELGKFVLVTIMFGGLFALNRTVVPEAVFLGYSASWVLGMVLSARWLK